MANKDVKKEEKKLKAEDKKVVADKPKEKEEKKITKWHAAKPVKVKCGCSSPFQDKLYGVGMRLHNIRKDNRACTVCGTEKM